MTVSGRDSRVALAAHVAADLGLDTDDVNRVLTAFLEAVGDALADGRTVQLRGFATIRGIARGARRVHMPTGGGVDVPAHTSVAFHPSPALTARVNQPGGRRRLRDLLAGADQHD